LKTAVITNKAVTTLPTSALKNEVKPEITIPLMKSNSLL